MKSVRTVGAAVGAALFVLFFAEVARALVHPVSAFEQTSISTPAR